MNFEEKNNIIRYYLKCKYEIGGTQHIENVWMFESKEIAKNVLDLIKKDTPYLAHYFYIEISRM